MIEERKKILIVDDDQQMRTALIEAIQRLGYFAIASNNGEDAMKKLNQASYAMVITDMNMPRMDGLRFIREAKRHFGNIPILVITGFGTVENAVETMKEGAIDYLMKPFSFDALESAINSIIARTSCEKEIITESPEMKRLINLATNLASSDITVLIYGESGTGKELFARYIHRNSRRSQNRFIAVNCAAIPDNLLESELFGYEKGAFTGATERKIGKFELANGGTMLLDEIGEMSMILQAKLLRVLQEREIDRIGGKDSIPIDVRVIATTNRDLSRECKEGRFREDLYYRLSVFPIRIPSLRERREDIPVIGRFFVEKFSRAFKKEISGFTDEALDVLMNRQWRGNVRELENVIQRAVLLCTDDRIDTGHLVFDEADLMSPAGKLSDMEKELIIKTLRDVNGNKTKAAKILGISVRTIRNKLNEYGKIFPAEEKIA